MPTPESESADDALIDRLRPQTLLARALEDPGSPPPAPTPTPPPPATSPDAREPAAIAATLAEMFPEFQFEGVINRGGFGTVYRAGHRPMKRRIAVKILASVLTRNVTGVARFEREIAAIGALDHPGIVRAFDAGQRGGVWFLAMELVDGADLGSLSRALGPLPMAEACELIRQAALAIQHAHEHSLIHRDVKPSKVVGNDPYGLRIAGLTGRGKVWKLVSAEVAASDKVAGVNASSQQSGGLLRVTIQSPESRDVKWTLGFE